MEARRINVKKISRVSSFTLPVFTHITLLIPRLLHTVMRESNIGRNSGTPLGVKESAIRWDKYAREPVT